jgi:hypothetical protein
MGHVNAGGTWNVQLAMPNGNSLEWRGASKPRHSIYMLREFVLRSIF